MTYYVNLKIVEKQFNKPVTVSSAAFANDEYENVKEPGSGKVVLRNKKSGRIFANKYYHG